MTHHHKHRLIARFWRYATLPPSINRSFAYDWFADIPQSLSWQIEGMPSHKGHKGNKDANHSRASLTLLYGYLSPCHIIGSAYRRGKRATIAPLGRISDTGNRSARTLSPGRSRILDDTVSYLASDDLKTSLKLVKRGKKAGGTE